MAPFRLILNAYLNPHLRIVQVISCNVNSLMNLTSIVCSLVVLMQFSVIVCMPGDVVYDDSFEGSPLGWSSWSEFPSITSNVSMGPSNRGVRASDASSFPWYFSAPLAAMGDKSTAYGGFLEIHFGHLEYDAMDMPPMDSTSFSAEDDIADVILESYHGGYSIAAFNVMNEGTPGSYWGAIKIRRVPIFPSAFINRDGSRVTKYELVRCLQGLTSFRIRGGYFVGKEVALLLSVKWIEGSGTLDYIPVSYTPRQNAASTSKSCQIGDTYVTHSDAVVEAMAIQFNEIPRICTEATLAVNFKMSSGACINRMRVFDQEGNILGLLFDSIVFSPVNDLYVLFEPSVNDTVALNADVMTRISAADSIHFSFAFDPSAVTFSNLNNCAQVMSATLRFRATACNILEATGLMSADVNMPTTSRVSASSTLSFPRLLSPSRDIGVAIFLTGSINQDYRIFSASLSIISASSNEVSVISFGTGSSFSRVQSHYVLASIPLEKLESYLDSSGSLVFVLNITSVLSSVPSVSPISWKVRIVSATRNCFVRSFILSPW